MPGPAGNSKKPCASSPRPTRCRHRPPCTPRCDEIASRGEKALVFTQFRELTGPLEAALAAVFARGGLILHGGTAVKHRQALVNDFQRDDGPPFFVLSLKAGGTGLNLTAACHVIHFGRWRNPAVENQATE